ncbi:MAG: hypothetical protein AAF492_18160, partial [Verrucomicrobiota bacterium]
MGWDEDDVSGVDGTGILVEDRHHVMKPLRLMLGCEVIEILFLFPAPEEGETTFSRCTRVSGFRWAELAKSRRGNSFACF